MTALRSASAWTSPQQSARLRAGGRRAFPGQVRPQAGCGPLGPGGVEAGSRRKESIMSVYRVTEIIGTSSTSWEDAAAEAIKAAAGTIRDLRVAEVVKQDIHLEDGGAITYRTKLQLSFKYEQER
jgi:dodecin